MNIDVSLGSRIFTPISVLSVIHKNSHSLLSQVIESTQVHVSQQNTLNLLKYNDWAGLVSISSNMLSATFLKPYISKDI